MKKFIAWANTQPKDNHKPPSVIGIKDICPHPEEYHERLDIITDRITVCNLCGKTID